MPIQKICLFVSLRFLPPSTMPRSSRASSSSNRSCSSRRRTSTNAPRNEVNEEDDAREVVRVGRRVQFPVMTVLPPSTPPTNTATANTPTNNSPTTTLSPNDDNDDESTMDNHSTSPAHNQQASPSPRRTRAPQSLLAAARGQTSITNPTLPTPRMTIGEMRAITHQIMDTLMRKNTRDAYKYRILEFRGFCATIYNFQPECTRYTVTGDKLYQFLFYQVFRDQKTNNKKPGVFNVSDYDRLEQKYVALLADNQGTIIGNERAILDQMEPDNPLGFSSISTYRAAVRKLYDYQAEEGNGSNSLNWDTQICTQGVKTLLKIVEVSTKTTARNINLDICNYLTLSFLHRVAQPVLPNGTTRRK